MFRSHWKQLWFTSAFASPYFKDNPKPRIDHSNSNFLCWDATQRLKSRAVPTWIPWLYPCLGTGLLTSVLGPLSLTWEKKEPQEHQPPHHSFSSNPSKRVFTVYMHPLDAPGREPWQSEKGWIQTFSLFPWHGLAWWVFFFFGFFLCIWKGNFWYQGG